MNDMQIKEDIYSAATMAVEMQQARLTESNNRLLQAQDAYLQNVMNVALLKENSRRKIDRWARFISWCGFIMSIMLLLIIFRINVKVGYVTAVLGAIIVFLMFISIRQQDTGANNDNSRKHFFTKYSYAIPENCKLKR